MKDVTFRVKDGSGNPAAKYERGIAVDSPPPPQNYICERFTCGGTPKKIRPRCNIKFVFCESKKEVGEGCWNFTLEETKFNKKYKISISALFGDQVGANLTPLPQVQLHNFSIPLLQKNCLKDANKSSYKTKNPLSRAGLVSKSNFVKRYFTLLRMALKASGWFIARSARTLRFNSIPDAFTLPMNCE